MSGHRLTIIVIVVAVVVLAVYDIWVYVCYGVEATISRIVLGVSQSNPIIPFACGVLAGHFFWPQPSRERAADPAGRGEER